ncbi:MAG: major facilitator transporter [Pseudomonas sp.]|nr:major facilitator transporter [Pseudomonas sp.]
MHTHARQPAIWRNALLGIIQIMVWGGSFFLMAVLAEPVVKDTGWSKQWVYGSLSLGVFISALLAPAVGRHIARHGGRRLLQVSGLIIAAGLGLLAMAPTLAVFVFAWVIIGIGMACGLYDALYATLGDLYQDQSRRSITQVTLISGFATTIIWPLIAYLVSHLGWRMACGAYAVTLLVLVWPLYAIALPKIGRGVVVNSAASDPANQTLPDGRLLLLIIASFTLAAVIMTAISVYLISLLDAQGIPLAVAIGMGALIGPSQVGARLLDSFSQKIHPAWNTLVSACLVFVGLGLLLTAPAASGVGMVLYGLGSGIRSVVRGTLPLKMFGPGAYAQVLGRIARPTLIAQAITPLAGAYIIEHQGASVLLGGLVLLGFVNILCVLLLLGFSKTQRREAMA